MAITPVFAAIEGTLPESAAQAQRDGKGRLSDHVGTRRHLIGRRGCSAAFCFRRLSAQSAARK
jgi:hypothetical protein